MGQAKPENKKKIGILGGTFDPAHKGHIKISKEARKRFGIYEIIWAITKKNPYKSENSLSLNERIQYAKKINSKNTFIKVKFYEDIIKSNRTIDLIKYIQKKNKNTEIYFNGQFAKGISKKNTVSKLLQILDKKKLLNKSNFVLTF